MTDQYKNLKPVYAILRADLYLRSTTDLEQIITVKEVVRDLPTARREVDRLNALSKDGDVRYWYVHTRLYPEGTSAGPDAAEPDTTQS